MKEACTALIREDFPIPRAPQRSALFAGSPRANLSVFSTRRSRTRSIPLSSDIATRLTLATGTSRRPSGCHTKASAAWKSGCSGAAGASLSRAAAMEASASPESPVWAGGKGLTAKGDRERLAMAAVLCSRTLSEALGGEQAPQTTVFSPPATLHRLIERCDKIDIRGTPERPAPHCNWGRDRYSPRAFDRGTRAMA